MSKVTDLSWQWTSRHITVPPVGNLPEGRMVSLGSRGETYVTDTGAPQSRPDAPTLFLLHALACTGALTWYPHIDALSERYRVITLDQRWADPDHVARGTFRVMDRKSPVLIRRPGGA